MKCIQKFEIFKMDPSFDAARECGNSVSPAIYAELKHRWPQFFEQGRHSMHVSAPEGDLVSKEVGAFLREHGREPHLKRCPMAPYQDPVLYPVRGERIFDAEDLEKAEYFCLFPKKEIGFGGRHIGTNLFEIQRSRIKKQPIGKPAAGRVPICTDALRQELEAQDFLGLSFREVIITGRGGPVSPLWELWSDRIMPPLLNRLVDEEGNDYELQNLAGCQVDDFYVPALLRFPEAEVRRLQPLDAALTREDFGWAPGPYLNENPLNLLHPELILSQRVRQWCEKRKLAIEWYPVELA